MKKLLLLTLCIQLQAYDFNFKQIEDKQRIEAAGYSYNFDFEQIEKDKKQIWEFSNKNRIDFDWNEPAHQYFFWINLADMATTVYALENRDSLYEGNFLLDDRPEIEELLLQKVVVSYVFHQYGIFSGEEVADDWLSLTNFFVTLATIHNYVLIQKHD